MYRIRRKNPLVYKRVKVCVGSAKQWLTFSLLFQSADEKLRSLGAKHSSKSSAANEPITYREAVIDPPPVPLHSLVTSRPPPNDQTQPPANSRPPPDQPPPPIPPPPKKSKDDDNVSHTSRDLHYDNEGEHTQNPVGEEPPPLYPRAKVAQMAERRIQRQTRNEPVRTESGQTDRLSKRRSRSEGPHGRRKMRNSMHETSRSSQVPKHPAESRYSMYTGHISDDNEDAHMYLAGSDSPDSDDSGRKQWTKNPLLVKKTKRAERGGRTEGRKITRSSENGLDSEKLQQQKRSSRDFQGNPNSKKKDLYMYKENSPNVSQKSKYQKLEEMRKKRINLAVTSDEECSPQLRISRLRQRAMMSSQMFNNENDNEDRMNIFPVNYRGAGETNVNRANDFDHVDSKGYTNGMYYNEVTAPQENKHKSSSYLTENRSNFKEVSNDGSHGNKWDGRRLVEHPQGGAVTYPHLQNQQSYRPTGVNIASESPPMRSFREVKSNQPKQLKKAIERIELNPRSPNGSSDDSLDELIESNIQYLESEIESGKLKRESGNFSNISDEGIQRKRQTGQQKFVSPRKPLSASEEIKVRLKGQPMSSSKQVATVTKVNYVPQFVQRSNSYTETTTNSVSDHQQVNNQTYAYIHPNATYSPYMHRRNHEIQEEMSKSDSQLNNVERQYETPTNLYKGGRNLAPYPVLNKETGNVVYVQPVVYNQPSYSNSESSVSIPSVDGGMFSDVEYNIEVSERIKKWEKKVKPGEIEETSKRQILNTIQEFENFSDSNQKEPIETPLEIRRELRQITDHPDKSGVGKLSVNLSSSASESLDTPDAMIANSTNLIYSEPKVVSSETNLHRIFRVVQEPRQHIARKSPEKVSKKQLQQNKLSLKIPLRPNVSPHAQSMSNVTLSETEMGTNAQQPWPPVMAIDSDSGVRKSWRMSRYEEELNELKEMVSDNFRDLKKRFDSDVSETDSKPDTSPVRSIPIQIKERFDIGKPLVLNVESTTPKMQSPAPPRRKHLVKQFKTPPASPGVTRVTPKFEAKRDKPKTIPGVENKPVPEVWSPNMESRKGLVSMERVTARTLQTIPLTEDPIWKEMEGLTSFNKGTSAEEIIKEINFDDIDALLELATKGSPQIDSSITTKGSPQVDSSKVETSKAEKLMTSSFSQNQRQMKPTSEKRLRNMSDPSIQKPSTATKTFPTPPIRPLRLRAENLARKSSASALDEVLEDIRSSLQKKPLSPKLLKNFDTSESNSSTNISLQSPHTTALKFEYPKIEKSTQKVAMRTEELENTLENTLQSKQNAVPQQSKPHVNVPFIDPDYTQYPYIINGNYHLDPSLLSEKLKSTGLAQEFIDEQRLNPRYQQTVSVQPPVNRRQYSQLGNKESDMQNQNIIPVSNRTNTTQQSAHDLDHSVVELKGLAKEVEHKLGQIKSRIVSADEDKLDSVLLALRKFAPMTEQRYFDVRFTPFESDKAKKSKLEDALTELEKMYEILDLDDSSLLDRASRIEETTRTARHSEMKSDSELPRNVQPIRESSGGKIYRRSQIEEVERQTQNEFEDITNSFQVLIDEVTKQCQAVAQGSKHYTPDFSHMSDYSPTIRYTATSHRDDQRQKAPLSQFKHDNQTQRSVQDSYNNAIKELESVAKGGKPAQSSVYVNLNSSIQASPTSKVSSTDTNKTDSPKNMSIKFQSRALPVNDKTSSYHNVSATSAPQPLKLDQAVTSLSDSKLSPATESNVKVLSSHTPEQSQTEAKPQVRSGGRFRRRANPEHRKSMPVMTRTIETQTVETQTELASPGKEKAEVFKTERQNSIAGSSDGSEVIVPVKRKLSKGIAKMIDLFSSSDDEHGKESSIKHAHSAPDLTKLDIVKDNKSSRQFVNIDKQRSEKTSTPRSVKHRHEAKARSRHVRDEANQYDVTSPVTSEDGVISPLNKPPVYPNWKYPSVIESPSAPKTVDKRQAFSYDMNKAVSDTEREPKASTSVFTETDSVRRRARSVSDHEDAERPRSFHELMATFEKNPKRLEKLKNVCGLRKCASEDSMFTDLVLQKIYHSDTDLHKQELGFQKSQSVSGLKLALEIHVKGDT